LASGNTKKPKVKGERVTFDPGSRRTGLKVGSSVSLIIIRSCLPFSSTYLYKQHQLALANMLQNNIFSTVDWPDKYRKTGSPDFQISSSILNTVYLAIKGRDSVDKVIGQFQFSSEI